MITSLIITVILIVVGCFVVIQLYDFFESKIIRTLLIAGYGLFMNFMLFYWFLDNLSSIISSI